MRDSFVEGTGTFTRNSVVQKGQHSDAEDTFAGVDENSVGLELQEEFSEMLLVFLGRP
jgi:hypothetical protein